MRKLVIAAAFALVVGAAGAAQAAVLTLTDASGTIWTLTAQTGCTTCAISLTADFTDPSGEAGKFLDSVQWKIDGSSPASESDIGFNDTNAGTTADWAFNLSVLNANQCGSGGQGGGSVCGEWISGGAGGGFPIVAGASLFWNFTTTFESALPDTLGTGNIRAAFNNDDGSNFYIFSPEGGNFGEDGSTEVPEPSSLALFGTALALVGARLRRQK
jgi:hypothetical protein